MSAVRGPRPAIAKTPSGSRRANSVSPEMKSRGHTPADAGAVDKAQFERAFAEVVPVHVASGMELDREMNVIHAVLSSTAEDWEKRVEQLKRLRGLVAGGAADTKEFQMGMRHVDLSLQAAVRDLRSSLVREACITISYMAEQLGMRFERTAEMTLQSVLLLIPNSAKIMASSGLLAVRFVLQNVPSQKLIPILTHEFMNSKSKETRRACCDFLRICLTHFPKASMDRHSPLIQESIKRGISDADAQARSAARQAYTALASVYPGAAQDIYDSLDPSKKKLLDDTPHLSTSQSSLLSSSSSSKPKYPPLVRTPMMVKSQTTNTFKTPVHPSPAPVRPVVNQRSISAVDAEAARRAREKMAMKVAVPTQPASAMPRVPVSRLRNSFRRYSSEKKETGNGLNLNATHHFGGNLFGAAVKDDGDLSTEQEAEAISDIVGQLVSTNWTTKRDGLVNLQRYMARGYSLLPSEMELLRTSFIRLLSEQAGNIITLLLDTLHDFVRIFNLELGSWLYVLLSKLWNKQGAEQGKNVLAKLDRLQDLIRRSFPCEVQLQHIMRYMSDPGLGPAPNDKSKVAVVSYLLSLIEDDLLRPENLSNSSTTRMGLSKIIIWALEGRTPEVRRMCQEVLVVLNQLNASGLEAILGSLEKDMFEAARKLIKIYPRRASGLVAEVEKKKAATPTRTGATPLRTGATPLKANDENVNPANGGRKGVASPAARGGVPATVVDGDGLEVVDSGQYLADWSTVFAACPKIKRARMLERLEEVMTGLSEAMWAEMFGVVFPMLHAILHSEDTIHDPETLAGLLRCFGTLLRCQPERMRQFPELTIVSLLEVQRDASNTVSRAAEDCVLLAVHTFPCITIGKVLAPIISQSHTEKFAAIRFFAILCQETPRDQLIPVLPGVVPLLVTAFSVNEESSVRKEAVYALIYAKMTVGEEEMETYLSHLPVSKVRLFNVYYKRVAQA